MFLSSNLSPIFLLPYLGHLQHIKSFYRYKFIFFASRALKSMISEFYSFYDNLFANILSLYDHVFVSFFYRYMHISTNTGATMVGNLMKLNIRWACLSHLASSTCVYVLSFLFLYMFHHQTLKARQGKASLFSVIRQGKSSIFRSSTTISRASIDIDSIGSHQQY